LAVGEAKGIGKRTAVQGSEFLGSGKKLGNSEAVDPEL